MNIFKVMMRAIIQTSNGVSQFTHLMQHILKESLNFGARFYIWTLVGFVIQHQNSPKMNFNFEKNH